MQVVIKYVPYVGDSKRAMDEYTSEIAMGGHNTLVVHNTCEDSLLAAPIILDLAVLAELFQRITFKVGLALTVGKYCGGHPNICNRELFSNPMGHLVTCLLFPGFQYSRSLLQ